MLRVLVAQITQGPATQMRAGLTFHQAGGSGDLHTPVDTFHKKLQVASAKYDSFDTFLFNLIQTFSIQRTPLLWNQETRSKT